MEEKLEHSTKLNHISQMSADGNETTSTLSITLSRADSGKYLSCKAYNNAIQSEVLEDGWKLDIQCEYIYDRGEWGRVGECGQIDF
jgi:hypothetical protein